MENAQIADVLDEIARRGWLERRDVLNTLPGAKLRQALSKTRLRKAA